MGIIADRFRAEIAEWNKRWDERHAEMQESLAECIRLAEELRTSLEDEDM